MFGKLILQPNGVGHTKVHPSIARKKHSIKGRREELSRHHLDSDDMIWAYRHTAKEWLGRLLLNIYGYGAWQIITTLCEWGVLFYDPCPSDFRSKRDKPWLAQLCIPNAGILPFKISNLILVGKWCKSKGYPIYNHYIQFLLICTWAVLTKRKNK